MLAASAVRNKPTNWNTGSERSLGLQAFQRKEPVFKLLGLVLSSSPPSVWDSFLS